MTADEAAFVTRVRAKLYPEFAQLEARMRTVFPHYDEYAIAIAVCVFLETVEADAVRLQRRPR